jgi:predicted RNA methylase
MARLASQAAAGFFPTPRRVVAALCRRLAAAPHGGKRAVRVLDLCAGTGEPAAALARALGAESYGIDLNEERAAECRTHLDQLLATSAFSVRLATAPSRASGSLHPTTRTTRSAGWSTHS